MALSLVHSCVWGTGLAPSTLPPLAGVYTDRVQFSLTTLLEPTPYEEVKIAWGGKWFQVVFQAAEANPPCGQQAHYTPPALL